VSQRLRAEGVPMREFRTTTQNFSPAAIEIDAAMGAGRLRHDGNPVLEWCLGNVVGRYDARANVYPRNERPEQKIDAITTIVGIARCLTARPPGSRYNDPATRSSPLLDLASAGQRV
jgi:phage terminase large subunit-like protein